MRTSREVQRRPRSRQNRRIALPRILDNDMVVEYTIKCMNSFARSRIEAQQGAALVAEHQRHTVHRALLQRATSLNWPFPHGGINGLR